MLSVIFLEFVDNASLLDLRGSFCCLYLRQNVFFILELSQSKLSIITGTKAELKKLVKNSCFLFI